MVAPSLKNKKFLITAGPTWVAIDQVRVLSNVSTGQMGVFLAQRAQLLGAQVDLLIGPVGKIEICSKIKMSRFCYFEELDALMKKKLLSRHYDVVIHAAAVSDYLVLRKHAGKIDSSLHRVHLEFKRAPKLIDQVKRLNPKALLVMFKLETGVRDSVLLKRALQGMRRARADLVVANKFEKGRYRGFILGGKDIRSESFSKKGTVNRLFNMIAQRLKP